VHGIKRRASLFNTQRIDHIYQDPHANAPNLKLHYGDLSDTSNLTRVLSEVRPDEVYNLGAQSHVAVSFEAPGQPNHLIVRLTDDELYQCPVIIMQEVGRLLFSTEDAEKLRTYLLKGGFLWVDDFWGSYAWQVWESEIRKVFPANDYPIVNVPSDHALFHTMFDLKGVPQIPGIGTWLGSRTTSERGADSAEVHARAIADAQGRVMVFMTHNTDVSDSWEREGEDPQYFYQFSIDGYRVAVNVLLYAMTH